MNQRERITKLLLKQSLISLLKDKNINQISVKELCLKAEINRSTFYLHYVSSYELLEKIEQEIIDNTHEYLEKIEADDRGTTYILAFLDYIKRDKDLFTVILLKPNDNIMFKQRLINEVLLNLDIHLQLNVPEHMKQLTYAFLLNGILAMIQEWISEEFSISSAELAQLIFSLADHSLLAFAAQQ